jgi:predicted transcriptional regulator
MTYWEQILYSTVNPDSEFGTVLSRVLDELNIPVSEFADHSGISESLLYKITSGHRTNVQLENFKRIVQHVKRLEHGHDDGDRTVAVITNRESLEPVQNRMTVGDYTVQLQEYPSSTVEEAIRQSIVAEREGVDAIICGPITAYTLENIVYTPIIGLDVTTDQIERAIKLAVSKTVTDEY